MLSFLCSTKRSLNSFLVLTNKSCSLKKRTLPWRRYSGIIALFFIIFKCCPSFLRPERPTDKVDGLNRYYYIKIKYLFRNWLALTSQWTGRQAVPDGFVTLLFTVHLECPEHFRRGCCYSRLVGDLGWQK